MRELREQEVWQRIGYCHEGGEFTIFKNRKLPAAPHEETGEG